MDKTCTNQKMIDFFEKHKNEFVLCYFEVVKFEGIESDCDDDFYIVREWGNRVRYENSCIQNLIPLKNVLSEDDYNDLTESWKMSKKYWAKKPDNTFMNIYGNYLITDKQSGKIIEL